MDIQNNRVTGTCQLEETVQLYSVLVGLKLPFILDLKGTLQNGHYSKGILKRNLMLVALGV